MKDCPVPDPHSPSNQVADFLEYLEPARIIPMHKKPFMFPVNANTRAQGGTQVASSMEGMSHQCSCTQTPAESKRCFMFAFCLTDHGNGQRNWECDGGIPEREMKSTFKMQCLCACTEETIRIT